MQDMSLVTVFPLSAKRATANNVAPASKDIHCEFVFAWAVFWCCSCEWRHAHFPFFFSFLMSSTFSSNEPDEPASLDSAAAAEWFTADES